MTVATIFEGIVSTRNHRSKRTGACAYGTIPRAWMQEIDRLTMPELKIRHREAHAAWLQTRTRSAWNRKMYILDAIKLLELCGIPL